MMLDAGAQRARVFGKREVRWREIANASSLGVLHRLCYLISLLSDFVRSVLKQ